ncbi:MAG: kynureninase [Sinomicrobium sp.]|nr:kynureninase [Sinomicrobium sp.]
MLNENTFSFENTKEFAEKMDRSDPLKGYRDQFYFPKHTNGDPCIYFCGNSLGLQPKTAKKFIDDELEDWAALGVEGHFHARNPWMPYHEFLTRQMAEVVGAKPVEVVVMNSLTVNLHLMMVSFYRPTPQRHKIVIEAHAFPSDQYAVKSQIAFHGYNPDESLIELQPEAGTAVISTERIEALIETEGDSIALIMLGGVNYYSGQAFVMDKIVNVGHKKGCIVGFDLAHAAGNLVLKLHDWDVDFAVWCSYKYLNAGPGSVAGAFVHERHAADTALPRFSGWWGHDKKTRFLMPPDFVPIYGAESWQLSNAPVFAMAALRASLEKFHEAGMENLRAKSEKLTGFVEFLLDEIRDERVAIITPRNRHQRGCQLSVRIRGAGKAVFGELTKNGCIVDWREPDSIRLAPVPLYNSFMDVFDFSVLLKAVLNGN